MMTLLDIADGVLMRILSFLSFPERLRFRLVNKAGSVYVIRLLRRQEAFALCTPTQVKQDDCCDRRFEDGIAMSGSVTISSGVGCKAMTTWRACATFLMTHCPNIVVLHMPSLGRSPCDCGECRCPYPNLTCRCRRRHGHAPGS